MHMINKKIALVTGGTGYIGSNLVNRLIDNNWDVHVVVRTQSNTTSLGNFSTKITIHTHDGSTESMVEIVAAAKPDIVFHLASLFLSAHQPRDVTSLIQSNILFATQLLEAMNASGVKHLINTGTSWQNYNNQEFSPVNLYAASKQAFESIVQYYIETGGLRVITLKLFDTYGPNDTRPKLFSLLRQAAQSTEPLNMSPGEQLIDLVHISDVIAAFLIAAKRLIDHAEVFNESYAVTSGNPIPLRDLVCLYIQHTNSRVSVKWGARPYRNREVMTPWSKGNTIEGWMPKISLSDGLQDLVSRE